MLVSRIGAWCIEHPHSIDALCVKRDDSSKEADVELPPVVLPEIVTILHSELFAIMHMHYDIKNDVIDNLDHQHQDLIHAVKSNLELEGPFPATARYNSMMIGRYQKGIPPF